MLFMSEEDAFWMLCMIVERITGIDALSCAEFLSDAAYQPTLTYYQKDLGGLQVDQRVFSTLVRERIPSVHAKMSSLDMDVSTITLQWFMCLFVNTLPLDVTLRVWDCLFLEGPKILFRAALNVLKLNEKAIKKADSFEKIHIALSAFEKSPIDADEFLENCFEGRWIGSFSAKRIQKLRSGFAHVIQEDYGIQRVELKKVIAETHERYFGEKLPDFSFRYEFLKTKGSSKKIPGISRLGARTMQEVNETLSELRLDVFLTKIDSVEESEQELSLVNLSSSLKGMGRGLAKLGKSLPQNPGEEKVSPTITSMSEDPVVTISAPSHSEALGSTESMLLVVSSGSSQKKIGRFAYRQDDTLDLIREQLIKLPEFAEGQEFSFLDDLDIPVPRKAEENIHVSSFGDKIEIRIQDSSSSPVSPHRQTKVSWSFREYASNDADLMQAPISETSINPDFHSNFRSFSAQVARASEFKDACASQHCKKISELEESSDLRETLILDHQPFVIAFGRKYHEECFVCMECGESLKKQRHHPYESDFLCEKHFLSRNSTGILSSKP